MPEKYVSTVVKKPTRKLESDSNTGRVHYELTETEEDYKTGFDKLLEEKEANLKKLSQMVRNPEFTRQMASQELGVDLRTVTRYLSELRGRGVSFETVADAQMDEKNKRVTKLVKLIKVHPEYTRERLAAEIGVSSRTLYKYLDGLELVGD
jgi:DNA-binding transcriptional regulator LsrR (DeoR family)